MRKRRSIQACIHTYVCKKEAGDLGDQGYSGRDAATKHKRPEFPKEDNEVSVYLFYRMLGLSRHK